MKLINTILLVLLMAILVTSAMISNERKSLVTMTSNERKSKISINSNIRMKGEPFDVSANNKAKYDAYLQSTSAKEAIRKAGIINDASADAKLDDEKQKSKADDERKAKIVNDIVFKDEALIPKGLMWGSLKKALIDVDNDKMRTFLSLRLSLTFAVATKAFTGDSSNYVKCDAMGTPAVVYSYSANTYKTSCIKAFDVKGTFSFEAPGSSSLTSDIDIIVDFKPESSFADRDQLLGIKLDRVSYFIKKFNDVFKNLFLKSSLDSLDVNMYNPNFAYGMALKKIAGLTGGDKTQFINANRLASLLMISYDSLKAFKHSTGENPTFDLSDTISVMKTAAGDCGSFAGVSAARKDNKDSRNLDMIRSIREAARATNPLTRLCKLLRGNYDALEAYVPAGSIVDIGQLQGWRAVIDADVTLDDNFLFDSLLHNFAYAVEHYYHDTSDSEAPKKISKYFARLYFAAVRIKTITNLKTIAAAFKSALTAFDNTAIQTSGVTEATGLTEVNNLKDEFIKTARNSATGPGKIKTAVLAMFAALGTHKTKINTFE